MPSGARRACSWLCSAPVTSRLVTFSACSGLLVQRSWLFSGFDHCFPRVRTLFFLASPDPVCKKLGHCASCCVGGAGFVLEVSYGTAIDCALVEAHYVNDWRQQRTSTCSSKRQLAWLRPGVPS